MVSERRGGRPREARPLALLPMRELGSAMAQLRAAAGYDLISLDWINAAIQELYPDGLDRESHQAGPVSMPRRLDTRHLLDQAERGRVDFARRPSDHWLAKDETVDDEQLRGNPVPPWLVRAYDHAVGADGYLVDFYRWVVAMDAAHRQSPPRWPGLVPAKVDVSELGKVIRNGFEDADEDVLRLLARHEHELATRAAHRTPTAAGSWIPSDVDHSSVVDDGSEAFPEGTVLPSGSTKITRWVFKNVGRIQWTDRVLLHIGDTSGVGLVLPPFVPVPNLGPGETGEVAYPVRAPARPGTYRACFKHAWPNGTLCHPKTLLGVLVTIIVPPLELSKDWHIWTRA